MKKVWILLFFMVVFSVNALATRVDLTRAENIGEPVNIEYQGQTKVVSDFIVKNKNFLCDITCEWKSSQDKEGIVPNIISAGENSNKFSVEFNAPRGGTGNIIVDVDVLCHDVNSTFCSDSNFGSDKEAISVNYKFCGDGKADNEEECDKDDKKGKTCIDFGYSGGVLECGDDCKLRLDKCYKCGNGKIDFGEQCDGSDFGGKNCSSLGFSGGSLTCNEKCMFDTSACYSCGNNRIDLNENCMNCPSDVKCGEGEECNPGRKEANQLGCAPKCGNGVCDANEDYKTCPDDCKRPIKCGDGICDSSENCNSCKEDCACLDGYVCSGGKCVLEVKYEKKKEEDSRNSIIILVILAIVIGGGGAYFIRKRKIIEFLKEKREISVIMFADLKDFSKKVGENEDKTLRKLWMYENIIRGVIRKHNGRVVKTIGDAVMSEFKSTLNAIKCANEIQNLVLSKKDFLIRIGIHMGEVVHKKRDLFGEGVNIAARIESIAEPGSIYISEDVYRQVRGKLNFKFIDLGFKSLKNIKEQVRIYKI